MKFSEDFFQRETRYGFEIPEMMKRAWAAEMEVLQVTIDVCEKNGLQYFADGGTLLGAVRHQGFIPWDDDIDICLKRDEYMELIKILPRELPEGFAMTGMYADTYRMRRSGWWYTSFKVIADELYWDQREYMKRFHNFPYPRIGIDVFPLDYLPNDMDERELLKEIMAISRNTLENWELYQKNGELESRVQYMEKACAVKIPRDDNLAYSFWRLTDAMSSLYQEDEAEELTVMYYWPERSSYHMKKEWYQETIYLPFEQMQIAAPAKYREVLTAWYGDYTVFNKIDRAHEYPFYAKWEKQMARQLQAAGFTGTIEEFCQKTQRGELDLNWQYA